MKISKRDFLKISGVALIGVSAKPAVDALGDRPGSKFLASPNALTATRWAMVVNHQRCKSNCTVCIEACHRAHNVPHITDDPRHEIKWLWEEPYENAFAVPETEGKYLEAEVREKPFLTLCNHCDNPPCVRVCPTQATFKRPEDGIVMMDFHRCIGCRYCMAACPYGSRSFNYVNPRLHLTAAQMNPAFPTRMKGVVEKCNFCNERLAEGKIPACVEACPEKALAFGDLGDPNSEVSKLLRDNYTIKRKPELGTLPMVYYIV